MSMAQGTNGDGDGGIDVLSEVELVSFTASPDHIASFGASQLSWEVQGPQRGFHVTLNGVTVARAGEEIVQPQTTSYHVSAVSGSVTKALRTITVRVDDSGCEVNSLFNPQVTITNFLNTQIEARNDLYFNAGTEVIFSSGTIRFRLHLGKSISSAPDPSIEIDAGFGLMVSQGHIVPAVPDIKTDISFPWYVTGIFGAIIDLQLLISNANTRCSEQRSAIDHRNWAANRLHCGVLKPCARQAQRAHRRG